MVLVVGRRVADLERVAFVRHSALGVGLSTIWCCCDVLDVLAAAWTVLSLRLLTGCIITRLRLSTDTRAAGCRKVQSRNMANFLLKLGLASELNLFPGRFSYN